MSNFKHNLIPEIFILDKSIEQSSKYLTDKDIDRNIKNSIKLMGSCLLYLGGIRKGRMYDQLKETTVVEIFKDYPTKSYPQPKFNAKLEYKYTRQCRNHFQFILEVGFQACCEYEVRYNKEHKLKDTIDWYYYNVPTVLPLINKPLDFPIRTLPRQYRTIDLIKSMRSFYINRYKWNALGYYKRGSVPEWFNLTTVDVIKSVESG